MIIGLVTGGFRGGGRDVRPLKTNNTKKKKINGSEGGKQREREKRGSVSKSSPQIIIITCKSI